MLFCIWHCLDKNNTDVPTVEFWFFFTPYFPELVKIRALIWFPLVSQTLSQTLPHSGKYGQPFSNLFKNIIIIIYISQQKTLTLKTDIYMQSGNSAILYVTVMLNDALFFCYSLFLYSLIAFPFHFSFVFCPVLCVWKSVFCLKSVDTIRSMHYPPT